MRCHACDKHTDGQWESRAVFSLSWIRNCQHWQNGVIIWPPLSKLLHRSPKTETPSKLQVIKTKDKSNLSCLSYFLPGPRPRLAWDNFDKHFTLKSTCCEPKVCFRIWGIFKEHLLYMQTLAHFLIRSLPSSFVLNYIHTNIVSELYMQRLRIPWSLETLCQGPSPKLHNPPFRLLPYSAFCPLPFLMCSTPLWILASSAFLHSLSQKVFKKIVENHNHIWLLHLVNMLIQDHSLHSCQWLSIRA